MDSSSLGMHPYSMKIELLLGDITTVPADAIVNAANSGLMGGGGVDGAIHRAAGPALLTQCQEIRERQGPCPTGQVVATGAGRLPAKHVLHAVGPVWVDGSQGEAHLLMDCYRNALALAAKLGCRSIAFPAISTGIFGFPFEPAARCVAEVMEEFEFNPDLSVLETVIFVLRTQEQMDLYRQHLELREEPGLSAASQAHAFLASLGTDGRGRTIEAVLGFTNLQLEQVHDYVQWLFPLDEPSRFNPDAPLLDESTIEAIRCDGIALANFRRGLERMLRFYETSDHWAQAYDHNLLRISRILRSTRLLLGAEEARTLHARFLTRCAALGFDPGSETLGYWSRAWWSSRVEELGNSP